jgi:signal transduction histidine kinase
MKRLPLRSGLYLLIDVTLLVLCALQIPSLGERAQAPFRLYDDTGRILISQIISPTACAQLQLGDEILSWQGHHIENPSAIEFLADHHAIGDAIQITHRAFLTTGTTTIRLIPAYTVSYIVIVCFVGMVTWCLGVFVLLARPKDLTAAIMHWCMISMAVVVVVAFEGVTPESNLGYLSSILFFASYMGVPTTFLLLTTVFPQPRFGSTFLKVLVIYPPACALTAVMASHHYRAVLLFSTQEFSRYQYWFGLFHLLTFVSIGAGILIFVYSYATTSARDVRKKLKWVLWGLCAGPTPFLLMNILPQAFQSRELVPEAYTLVFLVIIPVAFAIAFVRHHLLDIEVVISRSTAYVIVLTGLLALYVVVVSAVASKVGQLTASAAAAVLVALLFEPARVRVQHFVDRRFFRVRYNFREVERAFIEQFKHCISLHQLAQLVVEQTDMVIPVMRLGFFTLQLPGNRLRVLAHKGFDLIEQRGIHFAPEKLKTNLDLPVALDDKIESGVPYESADDEVFHRWGMALVLPMQSEKSEFHGFLVLGEKKSAVRFSIEDMDLLKNVATQAGLAADRIKLHQEVLIKDHETERLRALNQLKSDFVSYVSHELRTPLTSIKLFADLLKNRQPHRNRKSQEFLDVIEGESERLDRMVTTMLDSAKIDEGLMQYQFIDADLREIAVGAMKTMRYQLEKQGFRTTFRTSKRPLPIRADPDAVAQAIINLIGNSIKYSCGKKYLHLSIARNGTFAVCHIQDRGRGISPGAIPHLFEKFYRDPLHSSHVQGIGLGLPLVKHIMDAHGGSIDVTSTVGKGSVFSLSFPFRGTRNEPKKADSDR